MFSISALRYFWHEYYEHGHVFSGHRHYDYEINIILKGEMEITCERSVYHLYTGDYIILPPFTFHYNRTIGDSPIDFITISFVAPNMKATSSPVFSTFTEMQKQLMDVFLQDAESQGFGHGHCRGIQPRTLKLFEVLFEYLFTAQVRSCHASDPHSAIYNAASTYMLEHICDTISLHEIAKACHVSISTLKNIFPKYTGMSCIRFFNEMKLDKAKKMLETGTSCTETSNALNFSSPGYFSRKFKAFHGISPSEIQKEIK